MSMSNIGWDETRAPLEMSPCPTGHAIGKITLRTDAAAKPPSSCNECSRLADAAHASDAGLGKLRTSHIACVIRSRDHAATGEPICLCGVLYTNADQAVHQRDAAPVVSQDGGWYRLSVMWMSPGECAPQSQERDIRRGYTTPRSDFRFVLNRSQWRDRAGFAPASTSRMRAFYFRMRIRVRVRVRVREYQSGALGDLSARCAA